MPRLVGTAHSSSFHTLQQSRKNGVQGIAPPNKAPLQRNSKNQRRCWNYSDWSGPPLFPLIVQNLVSIYDIFSLFNVATKYDFRLFIERLFSLINLYNRRQTLVLYRQYQWSLPPPAPLPTSTGFYKFLKPLCVLSSLTAQNPGSSRGVPPR